MNIFNFIFGNDGTASISQIGNEFGIFAKMDEPHDIDEVDDIVSLYIDGWEDQSTQRAEENAIERKWSDEIRAAKLQEIKEEAAEMRDDLISNLKQIHSRHVELFNAYKDRTEV